MTHEDYVYSTIYPKAVAPVSRVAAFLRLTCDATLLCALLTTIFEHVYTPVFSTWPITMQVKSFVYRDWYLYIVNVTMIPI